MIYDVMLAVSRFGLGWRCEIWSDWSLETGAGLHRMCVLHLLASVIRIPLALVVNA